MKECYMCGITEEKALLYEGIDKKHGFVNICRKCYFKNEIPLIERKTAPSGEEKRETVRERLSKMAHVNIAKKEERKITPNFEDVRLKDLVEKNFKNEISIEPKSPTDLVDNFHWIIMRKRRSLKISKEKLSEDIKEPLIAVESLEKGILPRDYKNLVKKMENYLRIKILKDRELDHADILNESKMPSGILIEDVKNKMQRDKEKYIDASNLNLEKINEIYGVPEKTGKNELMSKDQLRQKDETKKINPKKDDLSDKDISNLIWGK